MTAASHEKPFSLELGVTDTGGARRRLVLSSSFRSLHCTRLHAQIPLPGLEQHRGCWANLSVDLAGLTSMCFKADAFKALDLLTVAPVCKVRKIFTMRGALDQQNGLDEGRDPVTDFGSGVGGDGTAAVEPLPLRMAFPGGVSPPPQNWIISPATIGAFAKHNDEIRLQAIPKQSRVAGRGMRRLSGTAFQSPTHVAQSPRATTPSTDRKGERTGARRQEGAAGGLTGMGTPSSRRLRFSVTASSALPITPSVTSDKGTPPTSRCRQRRPVRMLASSPVSPRDMALAAISTPPSSRQSPRVTPRQTPPHSARLASPASAVSSPDNPTRRTSGQRGAVGGSDRGWDEDVVVRPASLSNASVESIDTTVARDDIVFTPLGSMTGASHSGKVVATMPPEPEEIDSRALREINAAPALSSNGGRGDGDAIADVHDGFGAGLPARRRAAASQSTLAAAADDRERDGSGLMADTGGNPRLLGENSPEGRGLQCNQRVNERANVSGRRGATGWALDACKEWFASDGKSWDNDGEEEEEPGQGQWPDADAVGSGGRRREAEREPGPAWSLGDHNHQVRVTSDGKSAYRGTAESLPALEEVGRTYLGSRALPRSIRPALQVPLTERNVTGFLSPATASMTAIDTALDYHATTPRAASASTTSAVDPAGARDGLSDVTQCSSAPRTLQAEESEESRPEPGEQGSSTFQNLSIGLASVVSPGCPFNSAWLPRSGLDVDDREQGSGGGRGRGEEGRDGRNHGSVHCASSRKQRPDLNPTCAATETATPVRQAVSPTARTDVLQTLLAASAPSVHGQNERLSSEVAAGKAHTAVGALEKPEVGAIHGSGGESVRLSATTSEIGSRGSEKGAGGAKKQGEEDAATDALEHLVLNNSVDTAIVTTFFTTGSEGVCTDDFMASGAEAGQVDVSEAPHVGDAADSSGDLPSQGSSTDRPVTTHTIEKGEIHGNLSRGDEHRNGCVEDKDSDSSLRRTRHDIANSPSPLTPTRTSFRLPSREKSLRCTKTGKIAVAGGQANDSPSGSAPPAGVARCTPRGLANDGRQSSPPPTAMGRTQHDNNIDRLDDNHPSEESPAAKVVVAVFPCTVGGSDEGEELALALNTATRCGGYGQARDKAKPTGEGGDNSAKVERGGAGERLMAGRTRRKELEELEKQELALVDLESSYQFEFGSVDLSQSPGGSGSRPAPLRKRQVSPPLTSPVTVVQHTRGDVVHCISGISVDDKLRPTKPHREYDPPGLPSPRGQQLASHTQRETVHPRYNHDQDRRSDQSRGGEGNDPVVFGSPDGLRQGVTRIATSGVICRASSEATPGAMMNVSQENVVEGADCRRVFDQERRGEPRKQMDQGMRGGKAAGGEELLFDPVLNCYYDKASDKYYGLP